MTQDVILRKNIIDGGAGKALMIVRNKTESAELRTNNREPLKPECLLTWFGGQQRNFDTCTEE